MISSSSTLSSTKDRSSSVGRRPRWVAQRPYSSEPATWKSWSPNGQPWGGGRVNGTEDTSDRVPARHQQGREIPLLRRPRAAGAAQRDRAPPKESKGAAR